MKRSLLVTAVLVGFLAGRSAAHGQEPFLKGRSCLEISAGLWIDAKAASAVTAGQATMEASTSGFLGALTYLYWFQEQTALSLSVGLLGASVISSAGASGVSQSASSVVPFLVGARYHFAAGEPLAPRVFAAGSLGPVLGFQAENTMSTQSATVQRALCLRLDTGMDFFPASWLKLGGQAGYLVTTDFDSPVAGRTSYSGPAFLFTVGFLLGHVAG
jgi:hypothetical protein